MNRLEEVVVGQPMIYARKVARDWDIQSKEEAEEVLHIFTSHAEKSLQEVYDDLKQCIKTYEGVVRIKKERGQLDTIPTLLKSIPMWKQEVKQIEKAHAILYPKEKGAN